MSLVSQLRALHRRVAPIVVLPLLLTVTTGVGYRLARDWFGMDREAVHWLMTLHGGEWLGGTVEPVVVLLNARRNSSDGDAGADGCAAGEEYDG